MDCLRLFTSSDSVAYPTPSRVDKDLDAQFRLLNLLDDSVESRPPDSPSAPLVPSHTHTNADPELGLMLSLHSVMPTSSSKASRQNIEGSGTFRKIGAGACGAIFAQDGKSLVVKLAKNSDETELIPEFGYFVPKNHKTSLTRTRALSKPLMMFAHLPTAALVTERIQPLPHDTRVRLIERFCPPRIKQKALDDPANKNYLVRVYLGSMEGKSGIFFSLHNFKLHLNQMLELELDVEGMARRLGHSLAILHWAAKTDAHDVEFVLGNSTKKNQAMVLNPDEIDPDTPCYTGPPSGLMEDTYQRTTGL
ncbi:hypothetical protein B0H63DRAFT_559084 [Podospora didyma]|uniref:Uncharacterized protein n=1 Tax=Podospora didyma TaxID=330526 RepID=A0AAE0U1Y4_9PEZI|nr:hypothetical protein B0H63DRAFT_559084 [Podospora didyma]